MSGWTVERYPDEGLVEIHDEDGGVLLSMTELEAMDLAGKLADRTCASGEATA